ncbi:MAG TPA: DUF559 domain-containing protein [Acidothermales bacterium]
MRRPVRLRDLRDAGISRAELRGPLWQLPARGVRLWGGESERIDPAVRTQAVAVALPSDAALTGWAAAYLLGVTDLDGVTWTRQGEVQLDVVVARTADRTRIRRPGVTTVRSELSGSDVVEVDGVRVTSPVRTAFELLRRGPLVEAVVAVDAMLHAGVVRLDDLNAYISQRRRWKGVPTARRALALANAAAESAMETRLRLLLVLGGFRSLAVNVPLYDTFTTQHLGRPDLLEEEAGLVIEYDGADHRQVDRHRADNAREHALESAGLTVVRFDGHDVFVTPGRTLDVAHAARRRGLDRDRRRDRWTRSPIPWWMEDE